MMKRQWLHAVVAGAGFMVLTAASAQAQVVQVSRGDSRHSVNFNFGGFFPTSEENRIPDDADDLLDDVLVANREVLAFDIDDFHGFSFGGEYLFALVDFLEAGVGAGYYQNSVPSVYRDVTYPSGAEIAQELKLRIMPITATIRFLPIGRGAAVEPYVGGGIGINVFRYSEVGDFVDFRDDTIFRRGSPRPAPRSVRSSSAACAFPSATHWRSAASCAGRKPAAISATTTSSPQDQSRRHDGELHDSVPLLRTRPVATGVVRRSVIQEMVHSTSLHPFGSEPPHRLADDCRLQPVKRDPAPFRHPLEALIELRERAAALKQRVASFGLFLDRDPLDEAARPAIQCVNPQLAVAFVQEVAEVEAVGREVVHEVGERPHAHHDQRAVVVALKIGGDGLTPGPVGVVALGLPDHRRLRGRMGECCESTAITRSRRRAPDAAWQQATPAPHSAHAATTSGRL